MSGSGPILRDAHRFAPAAPNEEFVYGSCAPGWHSAVSHDQAIDQWIEYMQDAGIERVCCLLTGQQLEDNHGNISWYNQAFGDEKVRHAPVPDGRLADVDTLRVDILPFLDDAVAAEERVVVHCLSGLDRTGHVLAAWLVHGRDYGPKYAVETVQEMGRDPLEPVERGHATRRDLFDVLALL